jgi:hypothetical protein
MEKYDAYNIKIRAKCPEARKSGCAPIYGRTGSSIIKDSCGENLRGSCLYKDDGQLIDGKADYDSNDMCEYDLNVDENTLKNYEELGFKPNYNGESLDIYDPKDVIGSVAEKIYDIDHEHKHKKGGVSSFERILIIIGIVLFSLLILVSGILIYRNMLGPNLANNVRQNLNSVGKTIRNNVTISERNLVKLMKSAKK